MIYFPYLRGRQYELLALREIVPLFGTLSFPSTPIPIIEPVKSKLTSLERTIQAYCNAGAQLIVICNPSVGEIVPMLNILALINKYSSCIIPAFIVNNINNKSATVSDFISKTTSEKIAIIHDNDDPVSLKESVALRKAKKVAYDIVTNDLSSAYTKPLPSPKVLIESRFPIYPNNSSFPSDSFFTDTPFLSKDYDYFGDFTILRRVYKEGGGPPNAVALHFLYYNGTEFRLKHFVSSAALAAATVDAMYSDALSGLLKFLPNPLAYSSDGANLYSSSKTSYPGLGKPKQFSIMHHIELRSQ